jgi:hypothetical protein
MPTLFGRHTLSDALGPLPEPAPPVYRVSVGTDAHVLCAAHLEQLMNAAFLRQQAIAIETGAGACERTHPVGPESRDSQEQP